MSRENSCLGKIIQISNSKIGLQLSQKKALDFEMDYENLFASNHGMLNSLSRKVNVDSNKVNLLSSVYSLGKIAGGDYTLSYVNNRIVPNKVKLAEKDIMFQNLQTVFPDLESKFTQEDLIDFSQLYLENITKNEVKIVKIIYYLNMVMQYYKNYGNYNTMDIIDFGFDKINDIVNQYKLTGNLDLPQQIKQSVYELSKRKIDFSAQEKEYLDNCISKYNSGVIEKSGLIEHLNDFRVQMEKKTKIR